MLVEAFAARFPPLDDASRRERFVFLRAAILQPVIRHLSRARENGRDKMVERTVLNVLMTSITC